MFGLSTPLWLAGLAALAVPVAIHLWSRRPARVIRIGSLEGLEGPPGPRALGRRLEELPLLLLRAGILAATVLGLAGLTMQRPSASRPPVRVVLVDPAALEDSLAVFGDPFVDSLRRAGTELRLLAPGFPALEAGAGTPPSNALWALLSEVADTLPRGSEIHVVGTPTVVRLGADRPVLQSGVVFHQVGSGDWAAVPGESQPYRGGELLADRPAAGIDIQVVADQADDLSVRRVVAAWGAAADALLGIGQEVVVLDDVQGATGPVETQLIIWLSGQSVSERALRMVDSGATLIELPSSSTAGEAEAHLGPAGTAGLPSGMLEGTVSIDPGPRHGGPLLVTEAGHSFLTVSARGLGKHYRLAARPDSAGGGLGDDADLAEIALLTMRGTRTGVEAARVAASQAAVLADAATPGALVTERSLAPLAWAIAALLLLAERLVAYRRAGDTA